MKIDLHVLLRGENKAAANAHPARRRIGHTTATCRVVDTGRGRRAPGGLCQLPLGLRPQARQTAQVRLDHADQEQPGQLGGVRYRPFSWFLDTSLFFWQFWDF